MNTVMNFKTVINKAKLAAMALVVIAAMTFTQSFANSKTDNPVEFKYVGTTNNQPVFQLNLHNSNANQFVITLRNANGEVLYTEKVEGKEIERRYRLDINEIDAGKITVEVNSKVNNSKVVYAVNRTTRVVEDVVITKL